MSEIKKDSTVAAIKKQPEVDVKTQDAKVDNQPVKQKENGSATVPKQGINVQEAISQEVGIIAKGTKITGDIVTDGHLDIDGSIEGNISARGNVRVSGEIAGDISCGSFIINEGKMKGNITAREGVNIGKKSRVDGDIKCQKTTIEGYVTGNVYAADVLQITSTASINGNITTSSIAIGLGAEVNALIKTIKKQ